MGKRKAVTKGEDVSVKKAAPKKQPKTLRDKILDLFLESEIKVDIGTIKAVLSAKYDFPDSPENKNKVFKMLKTLRKEGKIGKVGNSYHGGEGSLSFATINDEDREQKAANRRLREKIQCPDCTFKTEFSQIEETLPGSIEGSTESKLKCVACYREYKVMIIGNRHIYTHGCFLDETTEKIVEPDEVAV